jgi:hypothetical protein
MAQRLLMHQQKQPAPIANDRADVPREIVQICRRMMEKRVGERYQSAEDVSRALAQWLSDRSGGGNGVVPYLPLPDLERRARERDAAASAAAGSAPVERGFGAMQSGATQ